MSGLVLVPAVLVRNMTVFVLDKTLLVPDMTEFDLYMSECVLNKKKN